MHCFVVAWKLPEQLHDRLANSLAALADVYETLDATSLWSRQHGPLSVASIQSSPGHRGARCYRDIDRDGFTLVDGLCIDLQGKFSAFNAAELAQHWSRIPASVDGQFILVRGRQDPAMLEIVTDSVGILQLFYARSGSGWVFSNSVQVLKDLLTVNECDPLGTASYLALGWCVGNSTLVRGIECMPGGQHWCWRMGEDSPRKNTYFGRGDLMRKGQRPLSPDAVATLGRTLLDTVKPLGGLGKVECPITAGRDSRVMTALLTTARVPATYFTSGSEGDPDLEIGRQFAERFRLPYRVGQEHESASDAEWEAATWRLVQQTDGMGTLAHVAYALRSSTVPQARCVHLYGAGGETARISFFQDHEPLYYMFPLPRAAARRVLSRVMMSCRGNLVIRPETQALVKRYLNRFVDQMFDDGFASTELEALFYLEERVHRWVGNNFRQVMSYRDVFTPYCTRAFTAAAFSVPLLYRYADHVHYELLGFLNPDMQRFPFQRAWHPQNPLALRKMLLRQYFRECKGNLVELVRRVQRRTSQPQVGGYGRYNRQAVWLEQYLPQLRQRVFDQASSPLWDYIDRRRLEHLLHPDTPAAERYGSQTALFYALTLFHYSLACAPHVPGRSDHQTARHRVAVNGSDWLGLQ